MDQHLITRIVEAALMASSQPLSLAQLRGLFTLDEPAPEGAIEHALETLREQCAERGVELVETASGFRFQVQADVHAWVARLWTERQTRYTRATLETLAIIAYRQPITRGEIEQVRGVAVSSNIIKALEEREWIRTVGHRDVPGRPELLGTTKIFLDYFGLKSLDQLPPLSELKDFGELDPQLSFTPPAGAAADLPGATPQDDDGHDDEGRAANDDAAEPTGERHDDAPETASDESADATSDDIPLGEAVRDDDTHGDDNHGDDAIADDAEAEPADASDTDTHNDTPREPSHETTDHASPNTNTALVDDDDSTGA